LNLTLLLVHDFLFSKGIQAGDGPIKQAVKRHKARLQAELVRLKIAKGATKNEDLAIQGDERTHKIPRYARVNENLWDMDEAKQHLKEKGFERCSGYSPEDGQYALDPHIPNLLIFNSNAKLHQNEAYLTGKLILQDKASCMPAVVLVAEEYGDLIDATAAPGNKTSHLSALMRNKGTLFAFERDASRFKVLGKMLKKAGCKNVTSVNVDFLTTNPRDSKYENVTHILLDPSCSGSGIVNRLDHLLESEAQTEDDTGERLDKLAAFQLSMIEHAMKFPAATRIVYSTCSIHAVENELVVRNALNSQVARQASFVLAESNGVIPGWHRRGLPEYLGEDAARVIRCSPGEDHTNGFFVSAFVRKGAGASQTKTGGKRGLDGDSQSRKKKKRKKKSAEES